MKKLILILAAATLVFAAPAGAADQTVTITKNGFVPSSVTVGSGERVTFTNADTAPHQIVFQKSTGVTCTPANLVVQPAQSAVCTFATAGSYSYTDANQKNLKGTVVVQAANAVPGITLAVSPVTIVYGGSATLSGTLASHAANEKVTIDAQPCGASAKPITTVTTTTGGSYTFAVQPLKNTTYTARSKNSTSSPVTVKVRPRMRLGKVAAHKYSVRVYAADSLVGKVVAFQRYNRARSSWVTVKTVTLAAGPAAVSPTVISARTFTSSVRKGLRVRAVLGAAQATPCYLAGVSNSIYS